MPGLNRLGNTRKAESAVLKDLLIKQELSPQSITRCFTRHYTNMALAIHPNQWALFNFLVFMSDSSGSFEYSTKLMSQFSKAAEHAKNHYKADKTHYSTSPSMVRQSYVYLVENGLLVKLSLKGWYMINPFMVYNSNYRLFNGKKIMKEYLRIVNSDDISANLAKYCDGIKEKVDKELLRTNINLRKGEIKGNKRKPGRKTK